MPPDKELQLLWVQFICSNPPFWTGDSPFESAPINVGLCSLLSQQTVNELPSQHSTKRAKIVRWYCARVKKTYYKPRNTGKGNTSGTPNQWRNIDGTPKHWCIFGALLVEQAEYHRKAEQENASIAAEQQNNIKKYYQYRATTYWADNITELNKTTKQEC